MPGHVARGWVTASASVRASASTKYGKTKSGECRRSQTKRVLSAFDYKINKITPRTDYVDMSNDPKPRSPERLTMLNDIVARWDEDRGLLVTATFRYDEWCCGEAHETVDAIATVYDIYDKAQYRAARKRFKKQQREFDEILEAEKNRMSGEQLTLF